METSSFSMRCHLSLTKLSKINQLRPQPQLSSQIEDILPFLNVRSESGKNKMSPTSKNSGTANSTPSGIGCQLPANFFHQRIHRHVFAHPAGPKRRIVYLHNSTTEPANSTTGHRRIMMVTNPVSGDEGDRTPNPRLAKPVLSQLSYVPSKNKDAHKNKAVSSF